MAINEGIFLTLTHFIDVIVGWRCGPLQPNRLDSMSDRGGPELRIKPARPATGALSGQIERMRRFLM
jgi:hypothetical protein